MHVTSITLRFASFCLIFLISIQSIANIANQNIDTIELLASVEKDLQSNTYIKNILPYDMQYITTLLEHGNRTHQSRPYYQSVFRLFTNLFKRTPCLNATSFEQCVAQVPRLIKKQFEATVAHTILNQIQVKDLELVHRFQAMVNGMLFQSLSTQYDCFKKDPELFLNNLSQTITSIAQEEIEIEQLRVAIVRFLELGLGKVAWSSETIEESWVSVKQLSRSIMQLFEEKIIDDSCLIDDLLWSLLTRYCYFLEIYATEIPLEFYLMLEKELDNQLPAFLTLDEQESFIETKKSYFVRTVMQCKAQNSNFQRGIITR